MDLWQTIVAILVGITVIVTFIIAGVGGFRKAGYRAAIEALETTNRTQEISINTLRGEISDLRTKDAKREADMARNDADYAKREAKDRADIATLKAEVKTLLSQRPSIDLLENMSSRLDTYYNDIVELVGGKNEA